MTASWWKIFKGIYYLSIGYFIYLMIEITLQYIPINFDVAFLSLKQAEIQLWYYQLAFFSHVYSSIIIIIAGLPQFSTTVRNRIPWIHRNLGKLYILLILWVASPSGFIMAVHANGGLFSKISFIIQAVLWFYFNYQAYQFAKAKEWKLHRNFMLRSYALTLSAISLRIFKWGIANTLELPPMDTYKIVAWLGWLVNLGLVELYIFNTKTNVK